MEESEGQGRAEGGVQYFYISAGNLYYTYFFLWIPSLAKACVFLFYFILLHNSVGVLINGNEHSKKKGKLREKRRGIP